MSRIRPEIFDFEPDLGLELRQTKPYICGTVPTHEHTATPSDSGPTPACFDDDPIVLNCERAQPNLAVPERYQATATLTRVLAMCNQGFKSCIFRPQI